VLDYDLGVRIQSFQLPDEPDALVGIPLGIVRISKDDGKLGDNGKPPNA
jgi:hypothetical protein